jgi:hypothetical protein
MTFSLPKPCFHVLAVAFSCGQRQLIERNKNRDSFYITLFFPVAFLACVEILPDGICTGVPEPDFLDEGVTEGIVRKGEAEL